MNEGAPLRIAVLGLIATLMEYPLLSECPTTSQNGLVLSRSIVPEALAVLSPGPGVALAGAQW